MKIGLVGPSYQEESLPFDAQRSVNLYPVFDQDGKEVSAMYGTPGLTLLASAPTGTGSNRAHFFSQSTQRAFAVIGATLYEVSSAGTLTSRGTLNNSSGIVMIEENQFQLCICDGQTIYCFTYATNVFKVVSTPANFGTITFIDGYMIGSALNTNQFFVSAVNDCTTWNALNFASKNSSPDNIGRVVRAVGQLWLMGSVSTEVWTDTGNVNFPFSRITGATFGTGIIAPYTAIELDNSVFWVGSDKNGKCVVFRARGFSAYRISTSPMEYLLQSALNPSQLRAYTYQHGGRVFYVITGGGMSSSLVYDLSTQMWHERAYLDAQGNYETHLGACSMFAFGFNLVGDRTNGNIYILDETNYTDNGAALCRERIYTHIVDELKRERYNTLRIGLEVGVGTQTGQGQNPLVSLRLSKDGAKTWSNWFTKPVGKVGKYQTQVTYRRLGVAQTMTFNVRITDPVKVSICGSYLE